MILANSMPKLTTLIRDIQRLNPELDLDIKSLERDADPEAMSFFQALGISTPTPL